MDAEEREAVVGRSIEGWNSDEWETALRSIWDPEGMIVSPEGWPAAGSFKGWDAMVEQWRRVKGSWAEEHVELISVGSIGQAARAAAEARR